MTMLEMLTIPGMDSGQKLKKLRDESQRRMALNAVAQRRAAAAMSKKGKVFLYNDVD